MSQLLSPFKFLAPYSAKDKETFWGRDKEIQELYRMLLATNLMLLYGPSGTGKTSLVQCGLSQKFSGPDWIPLLIRRGENYTQSVRVALGLISSLPENTLVRDHLMEIYKRYKRPVYLFFDQFEEIFTLAPRNEHGKVILDEEGKLTEAQKLFDVIRDSINVLPCKFVFILREEFLGQLYTYEQSLPALFDFRLRVEPMNTAKINQVLAGTFENFKISCSPPSLSKQIAKNLLEGNATSQLAYLQVYLDRLWISTPPPVEINEGTLTIIGTVEKVLEVYLEEQERVTAKSLDIEAAWVRELLDSFVTEDNTKRPIEVGSPLLNLRQRLTDAQLQQCLTQLQDTRLIRKDNQYYELAHDALAAIIASKRTTAQRLIKDITQILRTNYQFWSEKRGGYLSRENVVLYDQYKNEVGDELAGNENKEKIISYIEDSRKENERERQELEEKNTKLEENKKELEENEHKLTKTNQTLAKTNAKQKWALRAIGVLLIVLVVFIVYGANLYNSNKVNLEKANYNLSLYHQEKANQLIKDARVFAEANYYQDALEAAIKADSLAPNSNDTKSMILAYRKKLNR
jgi:hypothetical protein